MLIVYDLTIIDFTQHGNECPCFYFHHRTARACLSAMRNRRSQIFISHEVLPCKIFSEAPSTSTGDFLKSTSLRANLLNLRAANDKRMSCSKNKSTERVTDTTIMPSPPSQRLHVTTKPFRAVIEATAVLQESLLLKITTEDRKNVILNTSKYEKNGYHAAVGPPVIPDLGYRRARAIELGTDRCICSTTEMSSRRGCEMRV